MRARDFLAFDLGAESGRGVLGTIKDERLMLRELSRFPNEPVRVLGRFHWNIFSLFEEMKKTLRLFSSEVNTELESLAVDTWGVDFGVLGYDGSILGLPYAYRDPRNIKAMDDFFKKMPRERIYELTGIQFMPFNSLFQLNALVCDKSSLLEVADRILFMPDIFSYLLSGEKTTEFTIASTSQLYDPRRRQWSDEVFQALGIPKEIMPKPLNPATVIGRLLPQVASETWMMEIPVVATASHDTASAIAAVPAEDEGWIYISSGTWSLVGIETDQPIITPEALEFNFTNEGGMRGNFRFLRNVTGLWLVQQCRKQWSENRSPSYDDLTRMAADAPPFKSMIDPDAQDFLNPPDMPEAIRRFCTKSGQSMPGSEAEMVRCILESLALKYRFVIAQLKLVSPKALERIHIIGGGTRNRLLCQFTADATGLPVTAGPVEATAAGNIMGQALALGYVSSAARIRDIVRNSFELEEYEPRENQGWDRAYERFQNIINT